MTYRNTLAVVLSTTLLAACGGGADNAADANASANLIAENAATSTVTDPSNPFAQSEMDMDRKMMAAVGVNAGDTWTAKMIEHHQGAVDMSRIVLAQNPTPEAAKLAQQTIDRQSKEIEELRAMRQQGSANSQSADPYRSSMMGMHQAMMLAKGADVSETYLRKMLEHHKGAVAMSDVALANGATGELRATVQKTRSDQQKEIAMIEALLRGEPMQQVSQAAAPKQVQEVKTEPASESGAAAKAKILPKSSSTATKAEPSKAPAAEPAAAPKTPAATCAPEHRAMGHC